MALTFIYGNSGSGKSEYMYRKIADMAEHAPYQHYFVVVPEQFTMSAQRSLVEHTPGGVIMNIDVVSFERLAYRVFDELGVHRTVMEETGKSLVLRRIVEENESDLTILKRNLTKMGYIGELKSVISELMQYDISPDDLEEFAGELDPASTLFFKLRDILSIYRSFDDYLQGDYVTAERVLDLLTEIAGESALLRDAVFFFDGYTGFTPVQMKLIRRLMHLGVELYVSVTLDVREPLYAPARVEDLFYMSHKMVNALVKAARDASFEIADPVPVEAGARSRFYDNPALAHLEQNLFRIRGTRYADPCADTVRIVSLLSPEDELRYTAAKIRMLVREKNYRYRDFAVICSDLATYESYADTVFALYDIPGFVDKKQSILYHPLTELVRAVSEIADTDYSAESVFRFLRTGLTDFTKEEIDRLENYCIEKGVRGRKRWHAAFESLPAKHGRVRYNEGLAAVELEKVNALRQRFVDQTEDVLNVFAQKEATVRERTEALYGLLCTLHVEDQLRAQTDRFAACGDELEASVNRQIYKIVIDLLDKMVDLLGEEVLSSSDYAEILEAGFGAARVGTIPPGNDCVILGDMERTRLDEVRVLFLLGVNDGMIPKKSSRQSILSSYDRELMEAHDLELAPGEREQMFLQRFYLYLALTKPSDALCLSYSRMNTGGDAIRPSYLAATLEDLFTDLHTEEIASNELLPLETPKSSVESWLTGLISSDEGMIFPQWKALHGWYIHNAPWNARIGSLFEAHFSVHRKETLDPALARALYGDILSNSFTRLESFGDCPYRHFLTYGLKLAERSVSDFTSSEMGSLFHTTLQKYGNRLEESDSWTDVTSQRQDEILRTSMGDAVEELYDPSLFETASDAYDLERAYRILRRSIWAITEQINRGDFRPAGYEVPINRHITGSAGADQDGQPALGDAEHKALGRLVGSIDRMDICEEEDRVSVRVFDYKSSETDLSLQNVYYGRQLQLPVYLDAAMESLREKYPDREIVPAGIFYLHLDDPMLKESKGDEEADRKALLHVMRPKGLLNSDSGVLCRMDRNVEKPSKSDVILTSNNREITSESFADLVRYVRLIIDENSAQMTEGAIEVHPYRDKSVNGCQYCSFKGVCGFDLKIPGFSYREDQPLSNEEALEMMQEKLSETE